MSTSVMNPGVVLVDAGRSAVIPDGPGLPETPAQILEGVIGALLHRSGIEPADVDELYLADPRYLPSVPSPDTNVIESGWRFEQRPFGLRTHVSANSATSLEEAAKAVEADPSLVVVVAASDFGSGALSGSVEDEPWLQRAAAAIASRWDVHPEEIIGWARSSCARSTECSRAGDFAREIVLTAPGYLADKFRALRTTAPQPARGASAVVLTSPERAGELGAGYRAGLTTVHRMAEGRSGVEPLDAQTFDELLAPCGVDAAHLDQLEVPEFDPVTPLAWIKATGISEYLVNPRGGDLGFGRLFRSGPLRSLVSMVNSLEATGGRVGAMLATDSQRTVAVVLTVPVAVAA